jgi:hypothetical protein
MQMDIITSQFLNGITCVDDIKHRIVQFNDNYKNDPEPTPKIDYKEDDDLLLIYSATNYPTNNPIDDSLKSLIIDKRTLTPVASQFNKLIYNEHTLKFLESVEWNKITVKTCYEGTMILVFYSHDKWHVCTRKCLDAKKSYWIKNLSYHDLFMDAIENKFTFDDLNKQFCYHFILLHYKNKNIVDYLQFGKNYKTVVHALTTELYTLTPVQHHITKNIIYPQIIKFDNLDDVLTELERISDYDKNTHHISTEGFILEYNDGPQFTILKLQTEIYKYLFTLKPNVSNVDALFLELYQQNKLMDILPFYSSYNGLHVINRIHNAMKTVSSEILNIYHVTRNHKKELLYNTLSPNYKFILYTIHGKYMALRHKTVNKIDKFELGDHKSITIHDVYDILKSIDPIVLRNLFIDRTYLLQNSNAQQYFTFRTI